MRECTDFASAKNTYLKYLNITHEFLTNVWVDQCYAPCQRKSYSLSVKHYHNTSWVDVENVFSGKDEFYLSMAYSTQDIESRTETLVYDAGSLLAAAGGNLCLFLGFSCMTCIWTSVNIIEQYLL